MTTIPQVLATLAQRVIQQRDTYGWSVERDEAINAMRHALAAPYPVAPVLPAGDAVALLREARDLVCELVRPGSTAEALMVRIDAALSKQVQAGDAVTHTYVNAGYLNGFNYSATKTNALSVPVYIRVARLSQSGQADSTGGAK